MVSLNGMTEVISSNARLIVEYGVFSDRSALLEPGLFSQVLCGDPRLINKIRQTKEPSSPKTEFQVSVVKKDGRLRDYFDDLLSHGAKLSDLAGLQKHITGFVREYREWLHPKHQGTFFLLMLETVPVVLDIRSRGHMNGLVMFVYPYNHDEVFSARDGHHVVVQRWMPMERHLVDSKTFQGGLF